MVGIGQGQGQAGGEGLGHLPFADQPELHEDTVEPLAGLALQARRPVQPGRVEAAALDQAFPERLQKVLRIERAVRHGLERILLFHPVTRAKLCGHPAPLVF